MSNAPSGAPIRVAVADDHPVVREGLVAMLETQPDFAIVGSAASGTDVLALVKSADPDVLLLDLEMPALDGVGVLRALRESGATLQPALSALPLFTGATAPAAPAPPTPPIGT